MGAGAAAIVGPNGVLAASGPDQAYAWASVTKLLTALVTLDAVGQGRLSLDEPAGPPGSTVRHLLAHASGLSVDSDRVLSPPGQRRIYSNHGFEVLGDLLHAGRAGRSPPLLTDRSSSPWACTRPRCPGSAAHGARGPVADLAKLAAELLRPRRFPAEQLTQARTTVFGDLSGVLPGFGRQQPNDWGLGFEIRGHKSPHWMSPDNSPSAFGHFGQAGAFCWVDPEADLACVSACDTPFGPWAATAWPQLSTRVSTPRGRRRVGVGGSRYGKCGVRTPGATQPLPLRICPARLLPPGTRRRARAGSALWRRRSPGCRPIGPGSAARMAGYLPGPPATAHRRPADSSCSGVTPTIRSSSGLSTSPPSASRKRRHTWPTAPSRRTCCSWSWVK